MMNPAGMLVPPVSTTALLQDERLPFPSMSVTDAPSSISMALQSPVSLRMARSTRRPSGVPSTAVATAVQTPSASAGGGVDLDSGMTM